MKKKLFLKKETITSLTKETSAKVFGGKRAPNTGYENDCITVGCPDYTGGCGGGGNGPNTSIWWTKNPPPQTVIPC